MKKLTVGLMSILLFFSLVLMALRVSAYEIEDRWELDRPSSDVDLIERVENASTNDEASVGIGVHIAEYEENELGYIYEGGDGVELMVSATANTRKGINYTHQQWGHLFDGFPNPQYMDSTNITGDNNGTWIDLPFPVCFYGGPGVQNESACYDKVWVCSNCFLSFDTNSTSPDPKAIPNTQEPNTLVAVFWTDLDPSGGSIMYSIVGTPDTRFTVVWDNVLNKQTETRETFGVIIEDEFGSEMAVRGQIKIRFLYKNVSGDSSATIGLEDQEGYKGYTPFPDPNGYPTGEDEVWFRAFYDSPQIREMRIKAEKSDNNTKIKVSTDHNRLRGYNLNWTSPEEDPESTFEIALKGGATLLMSKISGIGNPCGGLIFGVSLLSYKILHSYAREQWPVYHLDYTDAEIDNNFAYINASAAHSSPIDWPVDATFDDTFYWVFTDQNTEEHSIKLYAEVKYYSYKYDEIKTISTSVHLKMTPDISNDFTNPKEVYSGINYKGCLDPVDYADMYKINIENGEIINITMTPPGDANYDLYLYNGPSEDHIVDSSEQSGNATESINYVSSSTGYWYIKVKLTYWEGNINNGIYKLQTSVYMPGLTVKTRLIGGSQISNVKVWIDSDQYYSPVTVTVSGGTHTIEVEQSFVRGIYWCFFDHWENGSTANPRSIDVNCNVTFTAYYEKMLCPTLFIWNGSNYVYEALLDIHGDSDVTLQHRIQQPLAKDGWFYRLSLRELDNFTSHIDQVKLYAVDSNGEAHICPLVSAIHTELGWVTFRLRFDDNLRVDLAPAETIELKFTCYSDDIAYFIFEINGYNSKMP